MNLRQLISSAPLLRRLWRFLPGPLRIPVLVLGAILWLWRRGKGEEPVPSGRPGRPSRREDPGTRHP